MAQKLRIQEHQAHESAPSVQTATLHEDFLFVDPVFKKDMVKSICFALFITLFEIALYFIYYLRVWERR